MPPTGVVEPVSPIVINQAASASFSVALTIASVRVAETGRCGFAGSAGRAGTSVTSGFGRAHVAAGTPPVIHVWTASSAQPE